MTASRAASVGQAFQSWATTLGIIIAGVWAVYTFIYKEIIIPETSPINVSVNLSIKEAGTASDNPTGPDLSAVEVALTATNPSARTVYILGGAFGIFGQRITSPEESDKFIDAVRADISTSGGYYAEKYAKASAAELLAGGQPIEDFALRPGETARRSLIIHFPRKTYDQMEVQVYIATVGSLKGRKEVSVKWSLTDKVHFTVYGTDNGKQRMIPNMNIPEDEFLDSVGFQVFTTSGQLSLWHGESGR